MIILMLFNVDLTKLSLSGFFFQADFSANYPADNPANSKLEDLGAMG